MTEDYSDDIEDIRIRQEYTLHEKVDLAVETYCTEICASIAIMLPGAEISIDKDLVTDITEKFYSRRIYVRTKFGCVVILPDFAKISSAGVVINMGMARGMFLEGFTDEQVEEEGKIFSNPLGYSTRNVEILAYYLSHKVDTSR